MGEIIHNDGGMKLNNVRRLLGELPKAELHVHIEGTLEPELLFKIAARNNIKVEHARDPQHLKSLYDFSDLQSFLDLYYLGVNCLQTEEDFYELTSAYLDRVWQDGCRHVEMFFDPQSHTQRGIDVGVVINGISRALTEARERYGLTSYLIMCFLKHLSEQDAFHVLDMSLPYLDKIKGVGLDSTEIGNKAEKFARLFKRAQELGLERVSHAGEEGPAENIWDCLRCLGVSRIDHGVTCSQDAHLLDELASKKIPLTVCPLSNIKLKVFQRLEDHNLKRLFDHGIRVTINSDDPAYFGGYLLDNYVACYTGMKLPVENLVQIAKYSFEASFLPKEQVERRLDEIDRLYENFKQCVQ